MPEETTHPNNDFKVIGLRLASPEEIISWGHGEVVKPETINYRTGKPERDGLFDERIFGPTKDWECYCGKYRRIRYKGVVCDKCGVEVTRAIVRRERMGFIKLASPVSHIWFLRGIPSKVGLLLDMSVNDLEKVIYFAGYIVTKIDEKARMKTLEDIDHEYKLKVKAMPESEQKNLKEMKDATREELRDLAVHQVLSEVEYHRMARKFGEVFEASIGAEAIRKILERMDLSALRERMQNDSPNQTPLAQRKTLRRIQAVSDMLRSGIRPEWMFLTVIPVIPPDLRPMVQLDGGRYATSDLNDLYRRVINRNNRLKRLFELKAPEVITRNEKRMLQEAVDALVDNSIRRGASPAASQIQRRPLKSLADILKGKQGRFRQNLLGKRVDYSGRSVIVVGPDLELHQCGLPKKMALELFKPFVIRKLIEKEIAHNIRGAGKLIEDQNPHVWAVLEEVIAGRAVILNRAPTLHRLGIQAFYPVLIEGDAIQLHPLVCPAFNADFDGDQMAVHLPLTDEAQQEAQTIMLSSHNLLKPATGDPIVNPTQDIVLGCYFATVIRSGVKGTGKTFASEEEALLAYDFGHVDVQAKIKVRTKKQETASKEGRNKIIMETSIGRILFNRVLPDDFPFVNHELRNRDLAEIVTRIIKGYGIAGTPSILNRIKKFGFEYATRSGTSWGIDDLKLPAEKPALIEAAREEVAVIIDQFQQGLLTDLERYNRIVEIWQGVVDKITKLVPATLDQQGSIFSMVDSRARGSWTQIRQMAGMKGLVVNPASRIIELPVLSSYKEGLNVLEYFISTHGARKGTADTALRTSAAGYLTRRLVDVAQDIIVTEKDCGAKDGREITKQGSEEINKGLGQRAFSRGLFEDARDADGKVVFKKGTMIGYDEARILNERDVERVVVRSPLTCRTLRGVCQECYGYDLGHNEVVKIGEAVGIVAAQAIGEPGTQLTMRTFHIGGVAGGGDITTGLPRVEEIFESRPPKWKAVVADTNGIVTEIAIEGRERILKIQSEGTYEIREVRAPQNSTILVSAGSEVKRGMVLTEGHADLKDLYRFAGRQATERYIVREVQKIYSLQGAPIHDKHVEVIVRQMFSRVRIKDAGDTAFTPGEVIEKQEFRRMNRKMARAGRQPAKAIQLLMGITRVALTTSSFLSAASFQETARVLIDTAIRGKKDNLRGLKENVIIGRLIPAGTGYRKTV
ncbi:MAG: DNA-directed RNA polymerase subunit beta' [Candidatus Sungbacteria bacterium RIFCSPHIGHO2_01_FULL_54_26]|uniref:DNA-directed RNA polymerase subunit beta' n=1 Tax=Candidatus Sungbacteria bacterium RIFCSPHIGHO2_02_FULL_53_17 TaxID=1802275 RepID=A0A1G2KX56_9BACT|nr:MAG: DNA-directed RNA polymerase subunit beta' [Candidatus Sungbacteria bacterium RIFCSPHIGHO2_01_FULL_54_26]OHA03009.1 MAG: DNA-directed RNA polymerase subunit beta' [Candidatus Sungbacteria bacterium RIFCSPHIGHO2_02_FULL_53_17]